MAIQSDTAPAAPTPGETIDARPVRREDVEETVDLLAAQEFTRGQSREALTRLVLPPWPGAAEGRVLTANGRVVGFGSGIASTRLVGGERLKVLHVGTWYVDVGYRRHSAKLLRAALSYPDTTLIALSANPHVSAILERAGFEAVGRRRLFYGGARLAALTAPRVEILDDPPQIEPALSEEHRRILRDHLPLGCGHYLVRSGDRYCLAVTKPRREKGWFLPALAPERLRQHAWPVSGVLHLSDVDVAVRHWARLSRHIRRRERTVGLMVEESFLGGRAPPARSRPRVLFVHGGRLPASAVDALYSEFALT